MQTRFFPKIETDIFLFFPFWKKNRSPFFLFLREKGGIGNGNSTPSFFPPSAASSISGVARVQRVEQRKKNSPACHFSPEYFFFFKKKFAKKRKENGLKSAPSQKRFCCRVNFCKGEEKEEKIAMRQRKKIFFCMRLTVL